MARVEASAQQRRPEMSIFSLPEEAQRESAEERRRQQRIALTRDIWRSSHPATVTSQVPKYLASRGTEIIIPPSIRVHGARGPYGRHPSSKTRPQMIALVKHADLEGATAREAQRHRAAKAAA
jgi:hypothetical protein